VIELPKRHSEARIDDFTIEFELESGQDRVFTVTGEALNRFAQMTNWDYYEAANRFQKVLEAAGGYCSCCDLLLLLCATLTCCTTCVQPKQMTHEISTHVEQRKSADVCAKLAQFRCLLHACYMPVTCLLCVCYMPITCVLTALGAWW